MVMPKMPSVQSPWPRSSLGDVQGWWSSRVMPSGNSVAIRNANVITMNPHQPRTEALAVREGRIAAAGSWADVAPHAVGLPVLDLAGKTVLPGFIDTHAHFLWTALSLAMLDVSGAEDHPALQSTVRTAVTDTPPGELILGMGFTEYALDTERFDPSFRPSTLSLPATRSI